MLMGASTAFSQDAIKIANIVEMSGPGTTSGVMFKQGVEMAIKEINAAGGVNGLGVTSAYDPATIIAALTGV